jgi:hypothetical protein
VRWGLSRAGTRERQRQEHRYELALNAYNSGAITRTELLIRGGLATWSVKLAYRFPRLLGHLSPLAAADRLRPMYAPRGGWRVQDTQAERERSLTQEGVWPPYARPPGNGAPGGQP